MKLSTLKKHLSNINEIHIELPNGKTVPPHFHITEAGLFTKHFIDCGGTVRVEKAVSLQIWVAEDTDHRLDPAKLLNIIALSDQFYEGEDLPVEIEYQTDTIGKYGLDFKDGIFLLTTKSTDCLAKDLCGIPVIKKKLKLSELTISTANACSPGGGCC